MVEEVVIIKPKDEIWLKQAIAKELYNKKIEQSRISKILNISQPRVSNYINSNANISNNILDLAKKISKRIIDNETTFFQNCVLFSSIPLEGNYFIANKNEIIDEEKTEIIDNLNEAFLILKDKDISPLIPAIKINIAMAKKNAISSDDIAAFLDGLVIADGKISSYNGIRFGKSKHLSSLLLSLRKKIDFNAIMNIAYIKDTNNTNLNYTFLTKDFKIKDKTKKLDALLHEGDFGIEPCTYIIGKDAIDVSKKLLRIKEEIK